LQNWQSYHQGFKVKDELINSPCFQDVSMIIVSDWTRFSGITVIG
jgi:hypothetical protein